MYNRKIRLIIGLVIAIGVLLAVIGALFYNDERLYIATDNAFVDGRQIVISAPAAGEITDWLGTTGSTFSSGSTIGMIQTKPGNSGSNISVPMPTSGTIVERNVVDNEFVTPGTPLSYAYNLNNLYVTANVNETSVNDLRIGDKVDVSIDSYPGITLHGTVEEIGLATISVFSILPPSNDTANFTKVLQVVPVRINIQGYQGLGLVPGLSVAVRIHK